MLFTKKDSKNSYLYTKINKLKRNTYFDNPYL